MLKNKVYIILLSLLFLFINVKIYKYYSFKQEEAKIVNIINKIGNKNIKITKEEQEKEFNLTKEYLGYIEIKNQNIKKLIVSGTDKNILDRNIVGMHKASSNIDDEYGNIILAGHNNNYVFKKLHNININDEILLVSHIKCYRFKVFEKRVYNINDYSYYKGINNDKILTLITCTKNNNRLIIKARIVI